tara:strand:+ start:96 stop:206 length:111 start_codon:yes stop_codon:yes gene_type:complete
MPLLNPLTTKVATTVMLIQIVNKKNNQGDSERSKGD